MTSFLPFPLLLCFNSHHLTSPCDGFYTKRHVAPQVACTSTSTAELHQEHFCSITIYCSNL